MPSYIDGFVIPVPADKIDEYMKIAKKASKVWKDHGALEYWECVGDDLQIEGMPPAPASQRSPRPSPMKPWSSPGSATSHASTVTR